MKYYDHIFEVQDKNAKWISFRETGMISAYLISEMDKSITNNKESFMNKHNKIKGATMAEYALIIGLIAAVAMVAVTGIGTSVSSLFTAVGTKISGSIPS